MENCYKTIKLDSKSVQLNLSVGCLICNDSILLDSMEISRLKHGLDIHSKICDRCKHAILYYRKKFESNEKS